MNYENIIIENFITLKIWWKINSYIRNENNRRSQMIVDDVKIS